jgi:hypothetical protein
VVLAACLWALGVALPFLSARRTEAQQLSAYTWELVDLVEEQNLTPEDEVILVNAPGYLTPAENTFLLGAEGSIWIWDYLNYSTLIRLNQNRLGAAPLVDGVRVDWNILKRANYTPYPATANIPSRPTHLITTAFWGDHFYPIWVGGSALPPADLVHVTYPESGAQLLEAAAWTDGDRLVIRTRWQQTTPQPLKFFLHVVCNGQMLIQGDGYPWGDLYPFSAWGANEAQRDQRVLPLPGGVSPECLQLHIGLYWENSGQRLQAIDSATATPLPDNALQIPLSR